MVDTFKVVSRKGIERIKVVSWNISYLGLASCQLTTIKGLERFQLTTNWKVLSCQMKSKNDFTQHAHSGPYMSQTRLGSMFWYRVLTLYLFLQLCQIDRVRCERWEEEEMWAPPSPSSMKTRRRITQSTSCCRRPPCRDPPYPNLGSLLRQFVLSATPRSCCVAFVVVM